MLADIIPTHDVAVWLLYNIDSFLDKLGLSRNRTTEEVIYVAIIIAGAFLLSWLLGKLILIGTRQLVKWRHTDIGDDLIKQRVFSKCSHIIPPLVFLGLLPFAFPKKSLILHVMENLATLYIIIVTALAINAVLSFIWTRYDRKENTRNLPLKGILNVAKGVVWIIVTIVGLSVVFDKSPAALLAGIGVFATALMLVFRDSILGFVAGIQLSQNDMLHVGDWIVVPSTIANGICIDVSLTAVKVQNWDNTIVTLPPYTLVSTSFQNWRGMSDSGYRLISRSMLVDVESVKPATPELIEKVRKLPGMEEFISRVESKGAFYDPAVACVNGSIDTNLGLLRAYMCHYLLHHPLIGTDQQILVRIMDPGPNGIPLQLYCYTTTAWTAYEAVQSEILEHLAVMAPKFGLQMFCAPAGENLSEIAGAMSSSALPPVAQPAHQG